MTREELCTCGHRAVDHIHGGGECTSCMCEGFRDADELEREGEK